VKTNQRLDYTRLAEALVERGLVEPVAIKSALAQALEGGLLLPQILVDEGMVSDWELARVTSEVFNLPFLTVEVYEPSADACATLDPSFLRRYCLVPLDRYEKLLTVAMPAMVPTDVLTSLARQAGAHIVPVVGTLVTNRRWLGEHVPDADATETVEAVAPALPGAAAVDDAWAAMFDAADAAVQLDIRAGSSDDGSDA
jgi:hypothetical protein